MTPMPQRRTVLKLLTIPSLAVVAACTSPGEQTSASDGSTATATHGSTEDETMGDTSTYTPLPDDELYAQIASLDGVAEVQISFVDEVNTNNTYAGFVMMESEVDRAEALGILDHAYAILRQGRPDAHMNVMGRSATDSSEPYTLDTVDLQLAGGVAPALEERYGPQPGTGEPPS